MFLLRPWTFSLLQKGKSMRSSFALLSTNDLWGVYCPDRSMLVPPEWTSALIWILVFSWYRDLHFSPWLNFRDLSVELCLSRTQWTLQTGGHPAQWFPTTNTISMMPAYTSSVPVVSKSRHTWIFHVFGTELNTNLKANRSTCQAQVKKQLANPKIPHHPKSQHVCGASMLRITQVCLTTS